jgi:hypothetical protein
VPKVLYKEGSRLPIVCERKDWKNCPEHKHLSEKIPSLKLTKEEKQRIASLEAEAASIAEKGFGNDTWLYPEQVYKVLGMKKPKKVTPEDANRIMSENIAKVLPIPAPEISEYGSYQSPIPSAENTLKCDECGNDLQLVVLKNGIKTYHHKDHAELDVISPVSSKGYSEGYGNISANAEEWTEKDIELVKANAEIGNDLGYSWLGPDLLTFGAVGSSDSNEPTKERNHLGTPAKHCLKCGSQLTLTVEAKRGGLFKSFNYQEKEKCSNCKHERVIRQG